MFSQRNNPYSELLQLVMRIYVLFLKRQQIKGKMNLWASPFIEHYMSFGSEVDRNTEPPKFTL